MAKTLEDLQSYLLKLDLAYQEPSPGTFLLRGTEGENIAVTIAGPVVVFRVKVMEIPPENQKEFFQKLLELNATEMMHGSYGLEGNAVVISDALQLENLDYNEFAATVDDIMLAVASHHKRLLKYRFSHSNPSSLN